jgi:ABC-type transport system involved in multi-copper enzyme maturation permease subunit
MALLTSLFNPVFHKELQQRMRSWQTLAAIMAVAVASSGLVFLRWPTDARIDLLSQAASLIFRPLSFALALAVMMLVPAFPATSLATERKRGTLALLLNSPCNPWQIYFAKLLSNIAIAMIIVSTSFPAIGACYAMGGISLRDHILPLLVVLLVMSIQYSAIGLWISSRVNSAETSLRWTYSMVVLLAVMSIGPLVFTGQLANWKAKLAIGMSTLSPISSLLSITGSEAQASSIGLSTSWTSFSFVSLAVAVLFASLTIWQIHPIRLDRSRPAGKVFKSHRGRLWRRLFFLVDPNKQESAIPRWLNPVLVKEFRTRKFGRLHWLLRIIAFCMIASLALTILSSTGTVSWGVGQIAIALVLMQLSLLMLVGPSLAANLIAAEIESGGWMLLRASPFSALRILSGKLTSVLLTMLLVLLATLPGYLVMSYIQPTLSGQIGNVVISLLFAVLLIVSVSACVSAFCKTTAVATLTSYAILLVLFAGTLLIWLARDKPFGPTIVEQALRLNPIAIALSEMETSGFQQYRLAPIGWYVSAAISFGCLLVLAFRTRQLTKPE